MTPSLYVAVFLAASVTSVECATFPALAGLSTKFASFASKLEVNRRGTSRSAKLMPSELIDKISSIPHKSCDTELVDRLEADGVSAEANGSCQSIGSTDLDTETENDDIELDAWDSKFWSSFDEDNSNALQLLTSLDKITEGWDFVSQKLGVLVEKKLLAAGSFVDKEDAEKGSKHACVKSSAVLDAEPESVFNLFADNLRVKDYNEHCAGISDVKVLPTITYECEDNSLSGTAEASVDATAVKSAPASLSNALKQTWSKISYAVTPRYSPFKSRDFLSVVHYQKYANGTSVILNRPAYLASHRPGDTHVRATVLLAGNIIRPHGVYGNQTHLTLIAQVNPGGGADTPAAAWLLNKLCAVGPPTFIRRLEAAARGAAPPAPAVSADLHTETMSEAAPVIQLEDCVNHHGEHHTQGSANRVLPASPVQRQRSDSSNSPFTSQLLREAKLSLQDASAQVVTKVSAKLTQLQQNEDFQRLQKSLHIGVRTSVSATVKHSAQLARELQAKRPALEHTAKVCLNVLDRNMRRTGEYTKKLAHIVNERMIAEMNTRYHCSGSQPVEAAQGTSASNIASSANDGHLDGGVNSVSNASRSGATNDVHSEESRSTSQL